MAPPYQSAMSMTYHVKCVERRWSHLFYVIKIIEHFIFPPGLFVLLAVSLGLYLIARFILRTAVSILTLALFMYGLSTPVVADSLVMPLETAYPQPNVGSLQADAIVTLGGGAVFGTPDMNGKGNVLGDSANRLMTTARLYSRLHIPIVLTGGPLYSIHGKQVSESTIAKRELIGLGVPASEIYTETRSRNTEENALFTKPILTRQHFTHPILVTSAFHMRRAVMDFHKAGVTVTPFPTDYQANRISEPYQFRWLPSASALALSETSIKEYVGIVATVIGIHG